MVFAIYAVMAMEDIIRHIEHLPNPRFPHTCVIRRRIDDDDPMTDDTATEIIYEGACRSFDFHTTSGNGDVITSVRKLSLPVKQSEWGETMPIPLESDMIEVDKGSHKEYGIVVDKMPSNLGTHILWKYGRN